MKKTLTVLALLMAFGKAEAQIYDATPYCGVVVSEPESALYDAMTSIQLNTINRTITPSDTNYAYFNGGIATTLNIGTSYPITINYNKVDVEPMMVTIYIDYNHNNKFDSDEVAYNQNNLYNVGTNLILNGTITVPGTALAGTTRMRILNVQEMISDSVVANPCTGTVSMVYYPDYGEAIDFDVTINGNASGVSEVTRNLTGILYPNPATNYVYIDNSFAGSDITITDVQGRQVKNDKVSGNQIDVSSLLSGIYFVRVIKNNEAYTQRLCIEK